MKTTLQIIAVSAAALSALVGPVVYDQSETKERFTVGTTWSGESAVFRYTDGRLFAGNRGENIGYFGGGRPRLVAFNCEGRAADAILIAMEEDELPRCKRIEAISGAPALAWSR
jgi:hypothetical protein